MIKLIMAIKETKFSFHCARIMSIIVKCSVDLRLMNIFREHLKIEQN